MLLIKIDILMRLPPKFIQGLPHPILGLVVRQGDIESKPGRRQPLAQKGRVPFRIAEPGERLVLPVGHQESHALPLLWRQGGLVLVGPSRLAFAHRLRALQTAVVRCDALLVQFLDLCQFSSRPVFTTA